MFIIPFVQIDDLYKLIILNRIRTTFEENNRREQAGFRRGFSTIDHIHTITQLTEKHREYKQPLCFLFIDFKKAFDTVEHNAVLQSLYEQGIDPAYIKLIKNINTGSTTQIKIFDEPINIDIRRGVRQGDVISPNLFTCALESIIRKTDLEGGININGELLQTLLFADDIVLISKNPQDLEKMLQQLSRKIGLEVHPDKTKWMKNEYCRN